jgi:hypothetical protein
MAKDRKITDQDNFVDCATGDSTAPVTIQDDLDSGRTVRLAERGVMNTTPPQPFVSFNAAPNEKIISHSNAYIVFGQDRPSTEASGEGGQGGVSDTIDLVVGRLASAHGGKGPCDGMIAGNSFGADAARIYISRSTKVDTNFAIMRTPWEDKYEKFEPARSAVAIKADNVRIIGRRGVKIVTGGMRDVEGFGPGGETDSWGNNIEPAPQIDLIAGNYVGRRKWLSLSGKEETYLQPIALGYRTRDAFQDLATLVDHLMGLLYQSSLLSKSALSGIGAAVYRASAATSATSVQMGVFVDSPAYTLRQGMVEFEGIYLMERAPRAVWSRNVNST